MDNQLKKLIEYSVDRNNENHLRKKRDTITHQQMRWKDAIIPYVIDASVGM